MDGSLVKSAQAGRIDAAANGPCTCAKIVQMTMEKDPVIVSSRVLAEIQAAIKSADRG